MSVDDAGFVTYAYIEQRWAQEPREAVQVATTMKNYKKLLFIYAQITLDQQTYTHTHTAEKLSIILYLIDVSWIGQATFWCIIEWWMFMSVADKGKTKQNKK